MASEERKKNRPAVKTVPRGDLPPSIGLTTAKRIIRRYHQHDRLVKAEQVEEGWPPEPGTKLTFKNHLGRGFLNELSGEVLPCINGSMIDKGSRRCRVQVHGLGPGVTVRVLPENLVKVKEEDSPRTAARNRNRMAWHVPDHPQVSPVTLRSEKPREEPPAASEPPRSRPWGDDIHRAQTSRRHQPCGETYAAIQATAVRDPNRLRHLGLRYCKNYAQDRHDISKRPWIHKSNYRASEGDWRVKTVPVRYVAPEDIPHDMGGHGGPAAPSKGPHTARARSMPSAAKAAPQWDDPATKTKSGIADELAPRLHPKLQKMLPRNMAKPVTDEELADPLPQAAFATVQDLARQAIWPGGTWRDIEKAKQPPRDPIHLKYEPHREIEGLLGEGEERPSSAGSSAQLVWPRGDSPSQDSDAEAFQGPFGGGRPDSHSSGPLTWPDSRSPTGSPDADEGGFLGGGYARSSSKSSGQSDGSGGAPMFGGFAGGGYALPNSLSPGLSDGSGGAGFGGFSGGGYVRPNSLTPGLSDGPGGAQTFGGFSRGDSERPNSLSPGPPYGLVGGSPDEGDERPDSLTPGPMIWEGGGAGTFGAPSLAASSHSLVPGAQAPRPAAGTYGDSPADDTPTPAGRPGPEQMAQSPASPGFSDFEFEGEPALAARSPENPRHPGQEQMVQSHGFSDFEFEGESGPATRSPESLRRPEQEQMAPSPGFSDFEFEDDPASAAPRASATDGGYGSSDFEGDDA